MSRKTHLHIAALLLVLTIICTCICSCAQTSDEDYGLDENTVTMRLSADESIPSFDKNLFYSVEICFESYYYTELPDNETLANGTKAAFIELCADVDKTSRNDVTRALIDCYIYAIGDKYSFYRNADEYEDYSSDMSGSFIGIGVSVLRDDLKNTIFVKSVEPDSPAANAGILPDDYIVAVDGVRVSEIGTLTAVDSIKGEEGTEVSVTVLRGQTEITFSMIREKITESTVTYNVIDGTSFGYVKIASFKSNTAPQFLAAVRVLEENGVTGIIFDLRGNPGGYLSTVESMLSFLVPTGTLIASFSSSKASLYATNGDIYETDDHVLTVPSIVMCDDTSASGAELFTGAMRDYNDMGLLECTIIGQTTYKKGIMQSTIPLDYGATLTLTTALYNPPSGQNFHGVGVSPDVFVNEGEDYMQVAIEELTKLIMNN